MISFLKKYIFAGSAKNELAPHIFIIICIYAILISLYTGLFFNTQVTVVRIILSLSIIIAYTVLERSAIKSEVLAFLSPVVIIALITSGAVYFKGDFLLFTYNIGVAMISLTYMKTKPLAFFIAVTGAAQMVLLLVFRINLLDSILEISRTLFIIPNR